MRVIAKDWDTGDIALVMILAPEIAAFYSGFLPSVFTIRHMGNVGEGTIETKRRDIRSGELLASGFSVALILVLAKLLRSPLPLFVGAITIGLMVSVYEWALAGVED